MSNQYAGITDTIKFTTLKHLWCKSCDKEFNDIDELINHYISIHNYKLLHIGTETVEKDSVLNYATIAIVGK